MPTNIAAPEAAAHAVLIDSRGWALIVQPSYKKRWHLPGGYVHNGETPTEAVTREVYEELGIVPEVQGPAVVGWAPDPAERILFLYVGRLTDEQKEHVHIDGAEIIGWTTMDPMKLDERLHPRVAERVRAAIDADHSGRTDYIEHDA